MLQVRAKKKKKKKKKKKIQKEERRFNEKIGRKGEEKRSLKGGPLVLR